MNSGTGRGARLALLALVVLAHLALLLAWRAASAPVTRPAKPTTIQIVMLPAPAVPPAVAPSPAPRETAQTPPRYRAVAPPRPDMTPAAAGAPDDPSATAVGAASPAASTASGPASPAPLNLELPRAARTAASSPSLIQRALNDPQANTQKLSFEKRMSADFDTVVTVEVLADGTRRIRRGADCVLAHPSRASHVDPFDRVHNQLHGVEKCP